MDQKKFIGKLKILMVARVLVATSILTSYYFFQSFYEVETSPLKWLVTIIIITYALTIIYALFINRVTHLRRFAYLQHVTDALTITSVLYITGGVTSPFSFLYTASIFSASSILYMRGALLTASVSSILYGLLVTFQLYRVISPLGFYDATEVEEITLYRLLINIIGFYLLALLSGFLSEKLRKIDDELESNKLYLEKLQELHDNVIRSINIGLIISDKSGNVITINDSALHLLGFQKSDLVAGSVSQFLRYPEIDRLLSGLEHESLALSTLEKTINTKLKGEKVLKMNFSFWKSHEGAVNGLVILLQDITAEKELERSVKLHEKLAAIGELAAGLAHEIRNPLASMNGSVQMLRDDKLHNQKQEQKLLTIIQREANRLNNIVTQFLNYAAPIEPTFREIAIKPFLQDFIQLLKGDERFCQGIEIDISVDDAINYPLDEGRVTQLLWNMALNSADAIKAAKPKKGKIVWDINEKGGKLVMTLRDNGTGISNEVNQKIFTPFYTTKGDGTGLGLALIHAIVKEHNGSIAINRTLAEGVEFKITFDTRNLP